MNAKKCKIMVNMVGKMMQSQ